VDSVAVLRQKLGQFSLAHIPSQDPEIQFVPHGRTSFILNAAPAYAGWAAEVRGKIPLDRKGEIDYTFYNDGVLL
jgi:hypothetical protein